MATDGPTPPPCDPEIFTKGEPVAHLLAASNATEKWVKLVQKQTGARIDWHYSGGIANVLLLGDDTMRERVLCSMEELKEKLNGEIRRTFPPLGAGEEKPKGLFRAGVTEVPPNALCASLNEVIVAAEPLPGPDPSVRAAGGTNRGGR